MVYNGGYVVSCGDSSVTLSDFQCLIQLQQVLKKGGSINSYKGAGQAVAAAIGAVLPAVSKWGGALCNALNAVGDTKIKGTVNTDKTSNNYGAVTYDSTAVKQIYDLLMKQYMESHGMSNFLQDSITRIRYLSYIIKHIIMQCGGSDCLKTHHIHICAQS